MDFLRPATWAEALALKAEHPGARPIAGGTDVMVELNFDRSRPPALLDLTAIRELATWERDGDRIRIGAGLPYARIIDELGGALPGLAIASRTVGSPQIRNRGTVGGNLGSASPAGDAHPPLLASDASVEVESVRGSRVLPVVAFFLRPKVSALEPDELIRAVRVPRADGPQQFAKIGTRNAMVIAVCSFAVALRPSERRVGTGIGSAAPTPLRARDAEGFLAAELDWDGAGPLDDGVARRFGELVAAAANPIDDVRGTAGYRRHALSVMARRTLGWTWAEYRKGAAECA
ncbi:FAD binding domain-containing protein [Actinomadura sp. HBU206391]|uniref:FAD binding domain-containing protein n=1 Tax=Actinomadura sp. HBU206391 TaxID=2731692 RepID=UPI001650C6B0|nr:FAD binding domain-containing protein [Actinomadura sp. HBU206391]MBC6461852.1 FAD binding domain-containing protein [Actinomadura sp. HBU206391]